MATNQQPFDRASRSDRPRKARLWIGLTAWLAWTAAWLVAAFVYGRPLRYVADPARALTLDAPRATMTLVDRNLIVTQTDGWRVQVSRLDFAASARTGPDVTDLEPLTRQALTNAQRRDRGASPEQQQNAPVQKPYSPDQRYSPRQKKAPGDPKGPAQYTPPVVQQYQQRLPNYAQQLLDALASDQGASVRPSIAVSPDGTMAAWVVGNALFTVPARMTATAASRTLLAVPMIAAEPVTVTRLGPPRCVPEMGPTMLALACDGWLEIREPRGGRLRHAVAGRFKVLRTMDGQLLASSGNDLFDIVPSGDSLSPIDVKLPTPARTVARSDPGRYAIATDDGHVVVTSPRGAPTTVTTQGVVDALAFLEDDGLVIGGAFRGIHVIRPPAGDESAPLMPDVVGTRFLAVPTPTQVAYATADRVAVLPWSTRRAFGPRGFTFIGVALLPFAVAIGFVVFTIASRRTSTGAGAMPSPQAVEPELPFHLPPPELPAGLIKACLANECVLYAGAGLSAQAGYPTWSPFVENLLDWSMRTGKVDPQFGDSLRSALRSGQIDVVADSLVSAVGKSDALAFVGETFGKEARLPDVFRLLKMIPLCAALTTNFDTLLERAYPDAIDRVLTPRDAERLIELIGRREFFIAKLYGSLSDPGSVLLAAAEYVDTVSRNRTFSQFMEGLFVSRTLLFVGASLEGIEAYLNALTFRGQMTRPHYALVSVTDAGWRAKADLLRRRYGIEVLPFTPSPNFPELPQFLERLCEAVAPDSHREPSADRAGTGEGLRRLHLQNIGPFPELTIDLQPDWNIILGDNGVGKSSILRAIAACFCGRDAEPYAARLIRAGEPSGAITLETARNTYRMEVTRKDAAAEVNVVPTRPLEGEGVLALGFPPLRAVSWERPKGPTSEGRRRAAIEDIIPLVKGDPDPRLDKLKQWIVNLDSRINYERSSGGDDRYERLLDRFFTIVDRVTPGMTIRRGHVDPNTREVTVITDDGEVPIEMVSQGSVSLMGWIGVLLQRLYELYGDDEDPTQRYALVLIDEIDAHMHPEWQQSVVDDMSSLFPHVQFVATTHSALVVGGMKGRQVMRFVREDGRTTHVPVTDEMLLGRADQILTGRLFGMKTTLDQRTQQSIEDYKKLLAKRTRTPEEEAEFVRLDRELKYRIPLAEETPPERKAFALVEAIVNDQIGTVPGARETVLGKLEDLMTELKTREGKPDATHHV